MKNAETKSVIWTFTAVALAASLVACGGGGSTTESGTEIPAYVLSGNAVKGAMNKAKVTAYKVKADGTKGDVLGTATTDAEGAYSIPVSDYTGVVLVEVTATADTTMVDEATGTTLKPATGFTLRTSVASPAGTGKTLTAQVNPLTEMAVAAALKSSGGLTAANVEKANSDLAAALGFNPTSEKPVFENGVPQGKAAITLAAISNLAKADDLAACASAADQAAKVKCVVEQLASGGLADASTVASLQNRVAMVAEKAGADAATVPAITQVVPSGTAPETTALAQAKAFISTLRSNVKALDAADMSLQTELQDMQNDVRGRVAPMTESTISAVQLAMYGALLWDAVQTGSNWYGFSRSFYSGAGFYGYGTELLGGCGAYQDTNYLILATSKANAKYIACGSAAMYEYATGGTYGSGTRHAWTTRVRLHPATTADSFTVYTQTRKALQNWIGGTVGYAEPSTQVRTHYGAAFPGNAATLAFTRNSAGTVTAVQMSGDMSPPIQRDWVNQLVTPPTPAGVPSYSYWVGNDVFSVLGDKLTVNLGVTWTVDASKVNTLALKGSVAQYKTVSGADVLQSSLALEDGSYVRGVTWDATQPVPPISSYAAVLKLRYATATSALAGQLSLTDVQADKSGTEEIPTKMAFTGSVERNGSAFFTGSVAAEALNFSSFNSMAPRSSSNVQSMKLTINGDVAIKDRPTLKVSTVLSETDKGTAGVTQTLSGQYKQAATVINFSGSNSAGLTLESSTGVKLVMEKGKTSYPLTKSGYAVGTFNKTTSRLTYTDGKFEQF